MGLAKMGQLANALLSCPRLDPSQRVQKARQPSVVTGGACPDPLATGGLIIRFVSVARRFLAVVAGLANSQWEHE